jgi:hypothetical protein
MINKKSELTPERKAQMRAYSKARYEYLKISGKIVLNGRPQPKLGTLRDVYLREYVTQRKVEAGKCTTCKMPCEYWNHVMFAWDHVDRTTKLFTISQARKYCKTKNADTLIKAEIDKCQLLCHNCHAYKTWAERDHDKLDRKTQVNWQLFNESNE